MHVIVSLLSEWTLAWDRSTSIPARGTLTRYSENRQHTSESLPKTAAYARAYRDLARARPRSFIEATKEEAEALDRALKQFGKMDFIVIDTPGSDSTAIASGPYRCRYPDHALERQLPGPRRLGRLDKSGKRVTRPSIYAEMVWEQRKRRAVAGARPIDWVVLRNRLTTLDASQQARRSLGCWVSFRTGSVSGSFPVSPNVSFSVNFSRVG